MNLEEILKKNKEELSAEEVEFLKANSENLSDDDKAKFGLVEAPVEPTEPTEPQEPTEPVAPVEPTEPQATEEPVVTEPAEPVVPTEPIQASEGTVTIKASELEELKKAAEQVETMKASEKVKSWCFNEKDGGKFPVTVADDLTNFYKNLTASQKTQFEALVEKMPNAVNLFGEHGGDAKAQGSVTACEQIERLAKEKIDNAKKAGEVLSYDKAVSTVRAENKELAKQANEEIESQDTQKELNKSLKKRR